MLTHEQAVALVDLAMLYEQASETIDRALASTGRDRLHVALQVVSLAYRIDVILDQSGLAPMQDRPRARATSAPA